MSVWARWVTSLALEPRSIGRTNIWVGTVVFDMTTVDV